jgi:MYXO-CTERM domain-containing protein
MLRARVLRLGCRNLLPMLGNVSQHAGGRGSLLLLLGVLAVLWVRRRRTRIRMLLELLGRTLVGVLVLLLLVRKGGRGSGGPAAPQ